MQPSPTHPFSHTRQTETVPRAEHMCSQPERRYSECSKLAELNDQEMCR